MKVGNIRERGCSYGFSSMGCPDLSFSEMISIAREFQMDFVELRALGGSLNLPEYFRDNYFTIKCLDIPPVMVMATDLRLCQATESDIKYFLKFAEIADLLGAPYLRIFGGGEWGQRFSASEWEQIVRTLNRCRDELREKAIPCELLLETHTAFSSSPMCLMLNERLDEPLRLLWDSHHTWRSAKEAPSQTWRRIGHLVRHIHFSDSQLRTAPETGYEVVLPGEGEYPIGDLRDLLAEIDFSYGVSLEWEKLWNPGLADVKVALKEFLRLFVYAEPVYEESGVQIQCGEAISAERAENTI